MYGFLLLILLAAIGIACYFSFRSTTPAGKGGLGTLKGGDTDQPPVVTSAQRAKELLKDFTDYYDTKITTPNILDAAPKWIQIKKITSITGALPTVTSDKISQLNLAKKYLEHKSTTVADVETKSGSHCRAFYPRGGLLGRADII